MLVIFGITGDLARVMTYRSLYRLEARGLLDCPIVGVAFDDWTLEQLVERARDSIVATGEQLDDEVFGRFAARLSYVHGDFSDAGTYAQVAKAIEEARSSPSSTSRSRPSLFGTVVGGLAKAGPHRERAGRRREAVRPRSRVGACAQCRAARATSTSRSSTGSTTSSGRCPSRTSSTSALRTRSSSRSGTGSSSRASRSRWARTSTSRTAATSTTRSARCATSSRTTSSRS